MYKDNVDLNVEWSPAGARGSAIPLAFESTPSSTKRQNEKSKEVAKVSEAVSIPIICMLQNETKRHNSQNRYSTILDWSLR